MTTGEVIDEMVPKNNNNNYTPILELRELRLG